MWVKICGNTNLADAALAAELGADAVGFIFAASPRQVTAAEVAAITAQLPAGVERIGVFDSHDAEEIAAAAATAGLTAVQLHGGVDHSLLHQLAKKLSAGVEIIQVLHWSADEPDNGVLLLHELGNFAEIEGLKRVLIDSRVGSARGGTGISYDWYAAANVLRAAPPSLRIIAAGGLKPTTVAQAIATLEPWGVDVSSGVESSPGRKDPALVRAFIQNARMAEKP